VLAVDDILLAGCRANHVFSLPTAIFKVCRAGVRRAALHVPAVVMRLVLRLVIGAIVAGRNCLMVFMKFIWNTLPSLLAQSSRQLHKGAATVLHNVISGLNNSCSVCWGTARKAAACLAGLPGLFVRLLQHLCMSCMQAAGTVSYAAAAPAAPIRKQRQQRQVDLCVSDCVVCLDAPWGFGVWM
jgi:hypothetical protein